MRLHRSGEDYLEAILILEHKHGYIDFLPNLCMIDRVTCGAAHGKLIRHKTLADGDGGCNYWILGDKEPEALADAGSK